MRTRKRRQGRGWDQNHAPESLELLLTDDTCVAEPSAVWLDAGGGSLAALE